MKIDKISTSKIMVVREYKAAIIKRNVTATAAAVNFALGINDAVSHRLPNMMISYGCTCFMSKLANDCHCIIRALKPEYKAIIKRAKQIYRHK